MSEKQSARAGGVGAVKAGRRLDIPRGVMRLCARFSGARIAPSEWATLAALPEYITGCAQ